MAEDLGTICVILLFGIGFALAIGSNFTYGMGFIELYNYAAFSSIDSIIQKIITAIINPMSLGIIGVSSMISLLSGNRSYTIQVTLLAALAQMLFMPFTFISELPIPIEIMYLIRGFFGILMILAVLGFVGSRRF